MAELPTIECPNPVVVPAVAAKTFNQAWIQSFTLNAPSPDPAVPITVQVALRAYDKASGELAPEQNDHSEMQHLLIPHLFAEAAKHPFVGFAMGAVMQAVNLLVLRDKTLAALTDAQQDLAMAQTAAETSDDPAVEAAQAVVVATQTNLDAILAGLSYNPAG